MRHDIGHKRQSIALVGTLNSGKTILALKLLPVEVKLAIQPIQTRNNLIPIRYIHSRDMGEHTVRVKVNMRIFTDEECIFRCIFHEIIKYARNSDKIGIYIKKLQEYATSERFVQDAYDPDVGIIRLGL